MPQLPDPTMTERASNHRSEFPDPHIEAKPYIEPILEVSPDFLVEQNRQPKVQENLAEWQENKRLGKLTAIVLCGDARVWIPERVGVRTASVRALGAGGDEQFKKQFAGIMNSQGVNSVGFFGHYDGERFVPKKSPVGCGITDEYARQLANGEEPAKDGSGAGHFAGEHIVHEDPVMQTIYSSQDAMELTNKWIGAVALDHRLGKVLPVGYFRHSNGGYSSETGVNPRYFDKRRYNAAKIYASGMPAISEDQLTNMPDSLHNYLNDWEEAMEQVRIEYAKRGIDYKEAVKTQNPSIISLSTDPRPLGIMYRLGPNTTFKLRIPRSSIDDDEFINPERLKEVLDQAHYPISQNLANHSEVGAAFSNTHTLLIQTKNMDKSRQIADLAMSQNHVQEWLNLPNQRHPHQIIVGQVNRGQVSTMEVYA